MGRRLAIAALAGLAVALIWMRRSGDTPVAESPHAPSLTDATFDERIATDVTVVDFWAPWCGPCRLQGPIFERVAVSFGERARFAKVNVDVAGKAASRYEIRSIPTIVIFKNGQPVERLVGVTEDADLKRAVERHLTGP